MGVGLSGSLANVRTSLAQLVRAAVDLGQIEFYRSRRIFWGLAAGFALSAFLLGSAGLLILASVALWLAGKVSVPLALAITAGGSALLGVALLSAAVLGMKWRPLFPHTKQLLRDTAATSVARLREVDGA